VADLSAQDIADASDEDLPSLVFAAIADGDDEPPLPQQHLYWVELLNQEVGCGGFLQYFHNTRGDHIEPTRQALEAIGATAHTAAFEAAIAQWTSERTALEERWRAGTVESIFGSYTDSGLPALDDGWYLSPIEAVEVAYIRANSDAFTRP
jgi:hypothetical protein